MEVKAGHDWFGVAEIDEIFEDAFPDEFGNYISDEEMPEDALNDRATALMGADLEICMRDVLRKVAKDVVGEAREETGRGPFSRSGPLQLRPEVSEDTASIDEQKDVLTKKQIDPED